VLQYDNPTGQDDIIGEPFQPVVPHRRKRNRNQRTRYRLSQLRQLNRNVDVAELLRSLEPQSASVSGSKVLAAKKIVKKAIYCIDNVNNNCSTEDLAAFVSTLNVQVISCFDVQPRRRRNDDITTMSSIRRKFRLCIDAVDCSKLLDVAAWPESVLLSEWYLKSSDNQQSDDERRRVDRRPTANARNITSSGSNRYKPRNPHGGPRSLAKVCRTFMCRMQCRVTRV